MSEMRFGTDGIRGVAGQFPIDDAGAARVGAVAARLASGGRVLIAWDTRPSSAGLAQAMARGVEQAGAEAVLAGVLPTAGLACGLAAGQAEAGVMITASHNPAADNGFKLFGAGGKKLSDARQVQVQDWLAAPVDAPAQVGVIREDGGAALAEWRRALLAALGDPSAFAGVRIVVDLAHGAGTAALGWLAGAVPADWRFVGAGDGVINAGVGSESPAALAQAVRDAGAWAGLAVDGDADRCLLVDESGRVLPGDALAVWLARARGVEAVALTVMSSAAVEPALPGVQVVRTGVGDRQLLAAMQAQGLSLGCEESGHVLFADYPGGDGLLAGLRALSAALGRGPVSESVGGFVPWPRFTAKLRVSERVGLERFAEQVALWDAELGAGGRVFLRYSGTEPVLRVLVEGAEAAPVERVGAAVVAALREALT